jgi:hypothetical protein
VLYITMRDQVSLSQWIGSGRAEADVLRWCYLWFKAWYGVLLSTDGDIGTGVHNWAVIPWEQRLEDGGTRRTIGNFQGVWRTLEAKAN